MPILDLTDQEAQIVMNILALSNPVFAKINQQIAEQAQAAQARAGGMSNGEEITSYERASGAAAGAARRPANTTP